MVLVSGEVAVILSPAPTLHEYSHGPPNGLTPGTSLAWNVHPVDPSQTVKIKGLPSSAGSLVKIIEASGVWFYRIVKVVAIGLVQQSCEPVFEEYLAHTV